MLIIDEIGLRFTFLKYKKLGGGKFHFNASKMDHGLAAFSHFWNKNLKHYVFS